MLRVTSRIRFGGLLVLCAACMMGACGESPKERPIDAMVPSVDSQVPGSDSTTLPRADVEPSSDLTSVGDAGLVDSGTAPGADAGPAIDATRPDAAPAVSFRCTQVIGYSQVRQWYVDGDFESHVEDDRWQLLYNGGAGVDRWQDPSYVGWSQELISPCTTKSDAPDRVLLSVSGPYGDDEAAWAAAIRATLVILRQKVPTASRIVLQPVVGGPNHQTCLFSGNEVRASWQHAHIDKAIAEVVGDAADIVAGMSPEVGDCDEYADAKGHFTPAGSKAAGKAIGEHYAAEEVAP